MINPKDLRSPDTTEIVIPYGNEAREPEQRHRDLLRLWQIMTDGEAICAVAVWKVGFSQVVISVANP